MSAYCHMYELKFCSSESVRCGELNPSAKQQIDNEHVNHRSITNQLELAKEKPVLFAVRARTNSGRIIDRCNVNLWRYLINFKKGDFLHVKDKLDHYWWIGRLLKDNSELGLIPSPLQFEMMETHQQQMSKYTPLAVTTSTESSPSSTSNYRLAVSRFQNRSFKGFLRRRKWKVLPYDVVPLTRPIVLIGPSLKGFQVTDMMQRAVVEFLKNRFPERLVVTKVSADLSLAKYLNRTNMCDSVHQIAREMERIFELSKTLKIIVLECDSISHPLQLSKTALAPIFVHLKVSSLKVLQHLIKSRGRSASRNLGMQLLAAEKLSQCPRRLFDVVLDENQFDEACQHLADYLEAYWSLLHA